MVRTVCLQLAALLIGNALILGCASTLPSEAEAYRVVGPLAPPDSATALSTLDRIRAIDPDVFEPGSFTGRDGALLPYRVLSPQTVEPGHGYPLVVLFHGAGEMGTDNLRQLDAFPKTWARPEIRERFPAFVLVPQMPERSALYSGPADTPGRHSRPGPPLHTALELIEDVVRTRAIDPARVYVVGYSMGASTAWNVLALRPDLFAAGVPIAGVPPAPEHRDALATTPLWIVHGNLDTANPIGPARAMATALQTVPNADVLFWEFDQMHHGVPLRLLTGDELMTWLFGHRTRDP